MRRREELIELCKVAAQYQGKYISHMRSEGNQLLEGLDELIRISREAKIPAEIYHIKAAGKSNWPKLDQVARTRSKRRKRKVCKITADMYTYPAARHGPRRLSSALDRGRRLSRALQAPARSRDAREDRRGSAHAERRVGEPLSRAPARPTGSCSSASNRRSSSR